MSPSSLLFPGVAAALLAASAIEDVCTVSHLNRVLPANGTLLGIDVIPSATTANVVYNDSSSSGNNDHHDGGPPAAGTIKSTEITYPYCNTSVTYAHTGRPHDLVVVKYALPSPSNFQNRFYAAGGGGYSLNSDPTGGLQYGAVSGATSAGYDAFDHQLTDVVLDGNGTLNWDPIVMFSYQALGEMTVLGKYLTQGFYGQLDQDNNNKRLYTYFEGCSDGGREAMSQVQRWPNEYDGVIAGAPAFRHSQQQVNHLFPAVMEQTLLGDTTPTPPPCELTKIVTSIISACDPLDGRTDGVMSRSDLCKLHFNLSTIIGEPYSCNATGATRFSGATPAQHGNVTAQGVAVAQNVYDGLHNSKGQRAYLSWQFGSELSDAVPDYDATTNTWTPPVVSLGGTFVAKMVERLDIDNLESLDNVTYDTLVHWMQQGMIRYYDTLQTSIPDLTEFRDAGGKLLHYHGESDPSMPAPSSIHYWQSVRSVMYPNASSDDYESTTLDALKQWYQLYLVPGAAHCGPNELQPDGPFPHNNMETMINWVENGVQPTALNASVTSGEYAGETQRLCMWPTRPLWKKDLNDNDSNSTFDCVKDTASVESWTYSFPAFRLPVF